VLSASLHLVDADDELDDELDVELDEEVGDDDEASLAPTGWVGGDMLDCGFGVNGKAV